VTFLSVVLADVEGEQISSENRSVRLDRPQATFGNYSAKRCKASRMQTISGHKRTIAAVCRTPRLFLRWL
jgi:hypothetical protein